jgi:regulatory protein
MELEGELHKAREAGLVYLSGRARSVEEVRQKLGEEAFAGEVVERVVADFERLKLLDDRELARRWVERSVAQRPSGATRLRQELRKRGVAGGIIDEVLAEFGPLLGSAEQAAGLLRKQAWRYRGVEEDKARRRMLGFLARRGYGPDEAREAVEQVWKEMESNEGQGD